MTKTAYVYYLVEPIETKVVDDGSIEPSFRIDLDDDKIVQLDYLERKNKQPFALRFRINGLSEERIADDALDVIHRAKEHFISIIRIIYDPNIQFFPHTLTTFVDGDDRPTIATIMEWRGFPDASKIRNAFVNCQKWQTDIRLLADSLSSTVPTQYQFLSLYKLLEQHLKVRGKWPKGSLDSVFSKYESDFRKAGFKKKAAKELHDLRDRCAHIKNNNDAVGVTQLSRVDLLMLERALPIIRNACINLLNQAQSHFKLNMTL